MDYDQFPPIEGNRDDTCLVLTVIFFVAVIIVCGAY